MSDPNEVHPLRDGGITWVFYFRRSEVPPRELAIVSRAKRGRVAADQGDSAGSVRRPLGPASQRHKSEQKGASSPAKPTERNQCGTENVGARTQACARNRSVLTAECRCHGPN